MVTGDNMIEYPKEFEDYKEIMKMGAKKHGANNWLNSNGSKSSFKDMHNSMFHHIAESYAAGPYAFNLPDRVDHESQLDPLLHAICRCQMMYTRLKRGLEHPEDDE